MAVDGAWAASVPPLSQIPLLQHGRKPSQRRGRWKYLLYRSSLCLKTVKTVAAVKSARLE